MSDWLQFVRSRLVELHPFVFNSAHCARYPVETIKTARLAYNQYHLELNRLGFGRDESGLPQLQSISILML